MKNSPSRIPRKPFDRSAPRTDRCLTCNHVERGRIEALLAGGASLRSVSVKFGIGIMPLHRHMHRHVHPEDLKLLQGGPAQIAMLAEKAIADTASVLDHLRIQRSVLMKQFLASAAAGDNPGTCRAHMGLLAVNQELGKMTGEISRAASLVTINNSNTSQTLVMADPILVKLQSGLLRALAPYPEARNAVIALLSELEAEDGAPRALNGGALPAPGPTPEPVTIEAEAIQ
jgi:hypothetical protein